MAGRHGADEPGVARAADRLAGQEPRPIDAEEHPAQAAGPHRLDVDALGQHGDLAAAHERDVAALVQHRLADREQHDHHAHAEGEAEQQEEGAELPDPEMAEGEGEQHQSRIGAVEHVNHPPRLGGQPVVVGHDHERRAVGVEPAEELEDLVAGGGVELAGGLVGEEHGRPVGERPGDGDPLHLAAGELGRPMARRGAPSPTYAEQLPGARAPLRRAARPPRPSAARRSPAR